MKKLFLALSLFFPLTSFAAVSAVNVGAYASDVNAGIYTTTGTIAYQNDKLYLMTIGVAGGIAGATNILSVVSAGMTWVQVASSSVGDTGTTTTVSIWRGLLTSGATAATSTIDPAGTISHIQLSVAEFSGMATSGTSGSGAIVQFKSASTLLGTSLNAVLDVAITAGNATYGGFTIERADDMSAGSGYTLLKNIRTSESHNTMDEFRADGQTSVNGSWSVAATGVGIGIEISAAVAGGGGGAATSSTATSTLTAAESLEWLIFFILEFLFFIMVLTGALFVMKKIFKL